VNTVTVADLEPAPIRCAGCGERLADRLGELVVVRVRIRAGQTKRVVGASGSGKSSLARAGLLAALREGKLEGSAA
jgi:ABC-type glutathione transport system ATPase component